MKEVEVEMEVKDKVDPVANSGESSDLARYQELVGCKTTKEYSDLILSALAGDDRSLFRLVDLFNDFEDSAGIDLALKCVRFPIDLNVFQSIEKPEIQKQCISRWGENYVFGFVSYYEPILQLYFGSWKKEDLDLSHLN